MRPAVRLIFIPLVIGWLVVMAGLSACDSAAPKYIGNTRSLVFHRQTCRHVPAVRNWTYFYTRKGAVDAGYRPCRKCKP